MVVEPDKAALYCVSQGTSEQKLEGMSWVAAVLLRPAAITLMTGRSMAGATVAGPVLPIGEPLPIPGRGDVAGAVRTAMRSRTGSDRSAYEEVLSVYLEWATEWKSMTKAS